MRRFALTRLGQWSLGLLLAGYVVGWIRRDQLARRR